MLPTTPEAIPEGKDVPSQHTWFQQAFTRRLNLKLANRNPVIQNQSLILLYIDTEAGSVPLPPLSHLHMVGCENLISLKSWTAAQLKDL